VGGREGDRINLVDAATEHAAVFRPAFTCQLPDGSAAMLTGRRDGNRFEVVIFRSIMWLMQQHPGYKHFPAEFDEAQFVASAPVYRVIRKCTVRAVLDPGIKRVFGLANASVFVSGFRLVKGRLKMCPVRFFVGDSPDPTLLLPFGVGGEVGLHLQVLIKQFIHEVAKKHGRGCNSQNDSKRAHGFSFPSMPMAVLASQISAGTIAVSKVAASSLQVYTDWEGITGEPDLTDCKYLDGSKFSLGGSRKISYTPHNKRIRFNCDSELAPQLTRDDYEAPDLPPQPLPPTGQL